MDDMSAIGWFDHENRGTLSVIADGKGGRHLNIKHGGLIIAALVALLDSA
jgi:hypothetical protein